MTITTNLTPKAKSELETAAQALLDAASAYHAAYRKASLAGAVVWVSDSDGRLVVLTRGEYRQTLMQNINAIHRDAEAEEEAVVAFDR